MQQDVHVAKAEEMAEVMVVSEGTSGSGPQIGNCFGTYFIIRG